MQELVMDAAGWETQQDLFRTFFEVVGAPGWHSMNFNALRDSIGSGSINKIEVPYRLVLRNYDCIGRELKDEVDGFIDLIRELASEGVAVEIRFETSITSRRSRNKM